MFRVVLAAIGAALFFVAPASAVPFEAQGWINADNHIHTEIADAPHLGTLSAPFKMTVVTRLHNRTGKLTFVDTQYGPSGTQIEKHSYSNRVGDATPEQVFTDVFTLDPAKLPGGWQEIRVRSNIVENGLREFTTTRLCINVQNGKGRKDYCGGPSVAGRCGSGAWYDDIDYRIVYVDCRDDARLRSGPIGSNRTVRVKPQDGPLTATIDPRFHAGDPGRVIATNLPANKWSTVTIPADVPNGPHKLHLRATGAPKNANEAGVYVLPFTVGDGAQVAAVPRDPIAEAINPPFIVLPPPPQNVVEQLPQIHEDIHPAPVPPPVRLLLKPKALSPKALYLRCVARYVERHLGHGHRHSKKAIRLACRWSERVGHPRAHG